MARYRNVTTGAFVNVPVAKGSNLSGYERFTEESADTGTDQAGTDQAGTDQAPASTGNADQAEPAKPADTKAAAPAKAPTKATGK